MFACKIVGQVGTSQLVTSFIYDPDRPFEIRLQHVFGDDIVFGRDLLSEAMSVPGRNTGWGDVRICHFNDVLILNFGFDGHYGQASYPAEAIAYFLRKTYDLVPFGSEEIDVDAMLDDFYNDRI